MKLHDPALLKDRGFIDGEWVDSIGGARLEVVDPASGESIGTVPDMGPDETRIAVSAASSTWNPWRNLVAKERAAVLRKWFDLILAHQEDLACLITAEQGKPQAEALNEILYGASFVEWFAEEAKRTYGDVIPTYKPDRRIIAIKQPIGVVAAITPWNFPVAMITRKVAPALAAGCTVVIKPAEETPLSALALAELAHRAGFPKGVLNVLTGQPQPIGQALMRHPGVRKVSFTGSTEVGKLLLSQSAETVKKLSLELGGNAPFIVFDDADIDSAVHGAIASKYRNAGQTCICANWLLVQDDIYEAFAQRLTDAVSSLRVGPGNQADTDIGPLINEAAVRRMEALLADAQAQGAAVRAGGKRHARGGYYFEPTVLTGAKPAMRVVREEIFGPIAPMCSFATEEDAIQSANAGSYGLAAYAYTRDYARVWRLMERLEYGIVGINEGLVSTETAPFGGMKQSGIGREGSKYGIDEFLEVKYVCLGGL
ncbi:MAG: NAD-dependent succinate-semialdehyde dehydrogenase [Methylococcaceae bacterium]|nr:MAG: NAD-dependent succinate-semialdehyde dehydrogenase [Methylococcaceae bacterium]